MIAFDTFAGTGWGVACQWLGITEYGVDNMPEVIATREANGMHTIYEDVWDGLEGRHGVPNHDLKISSPPCQTFSNAGHGAGRAALSTVLSLIAQGAYKRVADLRAFGESHDPRTALVLTPLAHIYRDDPMYVVLEQVPPVLPVWEAYAHVMRELGYSVWTGILSAEQFGVPQTRKRAVLMARRDGKQATPPVPTHSRFYTRSPEKLDAGAKKWVSMAEALGWGMTQRPYPTVATGTGGGGTDPAALGGSGARRIVMGERANGRWIEGHDWNEGGPSPEPAQLRPEVQAFSEVDRPSPTIAGDPRVAPRGCKHPGPGCCSNYPGTPQRQFGVGTLRLTLWEAQILQSYPPDFEFVGTRGRQFEQVGNAVPPLLGKAIIEAVLA